MERVPSWKVSVLPSEASQNCPPGHRDFQEAILQNNLSGSLLPSHMEGFMDKEALTRFMKLVDIDGEQGPDMQLPCWHWTRGVRSEVPATILLQRRKSHGQTCAARDTGGGGVT